MTEGWLGHPWRGGRAGNALRDTPPLAMVDLVIDIDNTPGVDFDRDGVVDGSGCDTQIGPPGDKEQCKNGGWSRFNFPRRFKNQGDCVQYVNTGK